MPISRFIRRGLYGLTGFAGGAAIAALPVAAPIWVIGAAAIAGAVAFAWRAPAVRLDGPTPLLLAAFFVPCVTMAVAPGQDMSMYAALGRGVVEGKLSPAWPGVHVPVFHRGLPALIGLLSLAIGMARASLVAAGLAFVVFWLGLTAVLDELRTPRPALTAALAMFLSRMPQIMFDWGGNPVVLALGLGLIAASEVDRPVAAAFLLAAASATHPMAAVGAVLVVALAAIRRRAWMPGALTSIGPIAVLAILAAFGPRYSSREIGAVLEWAPVHEGVPFHRLGAEMGDPAAIATAIAAAVLLWRHDVRPVLLAGAAVIAAGVLFQIMPRFGLYPLRFMPLLVVPAAALWGRASARWPRAIGAALLVAVPGHLRWFQRAIPMATAADVQAIECVARRVGADEVIDGAYGDATAWIPAITGRPITRPQQHISLFDEIDDALARQPHPSWRFAGQRLRYAGPIGLSYPPFVTKPSTPDPICGSSLYRP